jgi:predicted Zn-dependent peptidase
MPLREGCREPLVPCFVCVYYMSSVKTHAYPNGFRFVYEKSNDHVRVTHIQTFCEFGSAYEVDGVRGASHFIEHMCFKGTTHIKDSRRLNLEYDKIGAYMNAYTEKQYTCYVVKCDSNYTENMIRLTSDMLLNSKFAKGECEKEEKVVIEENSNNADDIEHSLFNSLDKSLYAGSAFEYPIDTLDYHDVKLECSTIHNMYDKFYTPNRMVMSIVTDLSYEQVKRFIDKSYFVKSVPLAPTIPEPNKCVTQQNAPVFNLKSDHSKRTTHVAVGFRIDSVDRHKVYMLNKILGGPTTARLFRTLREQNGLTYSSSASTDVYGDVGDITIYAETDTMRLIKNGNDKGVLPLIFDILSDIVRNGVHADELNLAKSYVDGTINTSLDNGNGKCENNGLSAILYPAEPICSRSNRFDMYYKAITKDDINEVARKYFTPNNMTVCIAGGKLPSLAQVTRIAKL